MNVRDKRGFTAVDVSVAVLIIIIFVSIITSAFYNYYLSNTEVARNSAALNHVIDVIEAVEQMDYEQVDDTSVKNKLQEFYNNKQIADAYQITTQLVKYNTTTGNTNKEDLIKILTVKIEYPIGKRKQSFEISRLIINK